MKKQAHRRARRVVVALVAVSMAFVATVGFGLLRFSTLFLNEIAAAAAARNADFAASLLAEDRTAVASAAAPASGTVLDNASSTTQTLLGELRKGVIKEFQLIGPDGVITAASRTTDIGKRLPPDAVERLRTGRRVNTRMDYVANAEFPVGTAAAYAPLRMNGKLEGAVGVWVDRSDDSTGAFRQLLFAYLGFSVIFLSFGIPTGILLRRYLLRLFMLQHELVHKTNELTFSESVAQIGHWSIAAHNQQVEVSPEAMRLLGTPRHKKVIGLQGFASLFTSRDSARISSGLHDLQSGSIAEFRTETGVIDSDGGFHDLRLVARSRDEGMLAGLFGVIIDITAEKKVRRSLRESESKFRLLADNASDLMVFYGQDYLFKYVSPSIERITGYKPDDLVGKDIFANVHPEDRQLLIAQRSGANASSGRQAVWRLKRSDGTYIWMESTASMVPDLENPGRFQIVSLSRDVTDRVQRENELRQAQAALQESEAKFRLLADSASDIISFYDQDRILRYVSPSVTRVTGYSAEEVIDTDTFSLVHPEDLPGLLQVRGLAGDSNPKPGVATWRLKRKDGVYIWIESSATIIEKPNGEFQVVSIARDITDRIEREAELKATQERLEAAAKEMQVLAQQLDIERQRAEKASAAKSQFLATMSHELRTPMTGIIGMAELLLNSKLTDEQAKQMRMLSHSAHILLDLLNEILDLSKIESGKLELESVDFRISDLIAEVREVIAPIAAVKKLAITVPAAVAPVDEVRGDPKYLRQLLLNLVANAVKFTAQGSVKVEAAEHVSGDDVHLTVSVIDTGIGISAENQKRLFQAFTQAETTTARRFGGTGLGLSISMRLAQAMGGGIAVTSEPGRGSTFTFDVRLKKAAKPVRHMDAQAAAAADHAQAPLHVLLAEDNETTRYLVTSMLERAGHTVVAVENGQEAINKAHDARFDIMLIDMHMPIIDGPEAIEIIRAGVPQAAATPIIALTADLVAENKARYLAAGANVVVGKPVDWAQLAAEMTRLTGKAQRVTAFMPTSDVGSPASGEQAADALNEEQLKDIEDAVGAARLHALLGSFTANIQQYEQGIIAAHGAADLVAARRVAHALRGLSAQFGAVQLAELAAQIEETIKDVAALSPALPKLREAVRVAVCAAERRMKT